MEGFRILIVMETTRVRQGIKNSYQIKPHFCTVLATNLKGSHELEVLSRYLCRTRMLRMTTPPLIVTFLLRLLLEIAFRTTSWQTFASAFTSEYPSFLTIQASSSKLAIITPLFVTSSLFFHSLGLHRHSPVSPVC